MKKVIRLTEEDINRIVTRIINEDESYGQNDPKFADKKKLFNELEGVLDKYDFLHARDIIEVIEVIYQIYSRKKTLNLYDM